MSTVRAQGRAWALTPRLQRRSLEAGSLSMASPATLGPYVLEAPLGVGGLGEVWRARDERLGRAVAIKLMRLEAAEAGRLEQEARLLARLNHPGIAALYDVGRCDRGWFLVMELVAGPGLDELVAAHPRGLAEAEVRRLGIELAAALAAAHAQGILHRDLKPSNLRLDASGRLKVLDFGLACLLEPVAETQSGPRLPAERAAGTLAYMAPEQWRGGALDERTDLWAAGAVLYELATGRRAFPQRSVEALEHAIVRGQPVPPAQVRPELSPALEAIILRLLERTPARRFPSAAALGRALARPLQPRPRPQPAGRVQVLVGALANHTGEAAFEGTLPELVFAALEQAPGLAVFPRARLGEALERMGAPGRQVDVAVGLELCQREGLAALLTGALHRLGHSYVLLLELHDRTGQRLCGLRRRFARPEQLLGVLDRMVRQLRQHLGESAAVVERTLPLERVTTPSLEALRCFTLGRVQLLGGDLLQAVALLERALAHDPDFVMAHLALAAAYCHLYDRDRGLDSARRAAALAGTRTTPLERERAAALCAYYEGDLPAAERQFAALVARHPEDPILLVNLGVVLEERHDYAGAIAVTGRAVALLPRSRVPMNLARQQLRNNELAAAEATAQALLAHLPGDPHIRFLLGLTLLVAGRETEATAHIEQLVLAGGEAEALGRLLLADLLASAGRVAEALVEAQAARTVAELHASRAVEQKALARQVELLLALGQPEEAARWVRQASSRPTDFWLRVLRLRVAARARVPEVAEAMAAELADGPQTLARSEARAVATAELALAAGEPARALEAAREVIEVYRSVLGLELLAEAALALGQTDTAAAALGRLLERSGDRACAEDCPGVWKVVLAEYRLGALEQDRGRPGLARPLLERVAARWHQADPDLPWVVDLRRRLATLDSSAATPAAST